MLALGRFGQEGRWRVFARDGASELRESPPPVGLPPAPSSWGIQFSADGGELLVGGDDGRARLFRWSPARVEELVCMAHGAGKLYVEALAFSPDNQLLVTGGTDCTVRCWRRDGSPAGPPLVGHVRPLVRLAVTPNGRTIVSMCREQFRVWRLDGTRIGFVVPSAGQFTDFALLPDERRVALASTDATVRIAPLWVNDLLTRVRQSLAKHVFLPAELAPFESLLEARPGQD